MARCTAGHCSILLTFPESAASALGKRTQPVSRESRAGLQHRILISISIFRAVLALSAVKGWFLD
jgi:hypothetical protein